MFNNKIRGRTRRNNEGENKIIIENVFNKRMKIILKIVFFILLFIILFSIIMILIKYFIKKNEDSKANNSQIVEKVSSEIDYLDNTLIDIFNYINNIQENTSSIEKTSVNLEKSNTSTSSSSKSENNQDTSKDQSSSENESTNIANVTNSSVLMSSNDIDWESIETKTEEIYKTWPIIEIDLNSLNVSDNNILEFNSYLDSLISNTKDQKKIETLDDLGKLYELLYKYMSEYSNDTEKNDIQNIKSKLINAYVYTEKSKWKDSLNELSTIEVTIDKLNNDMSKKLSQDKLNKIYVILKEIIKSANEENKDLFYLKFVNIEEELNKLYV